MDPSTTASSSNRPPLVIFSGNANPQLAQDIVKHLGIQLGRSITSKENDETKVQILDSVRGSDVFVIQPTCPPVNDHVMELVLMLDALKRSSPVRVTSVIPYFGYARQDRKHGPREPITARLMADLISAAGTSRVLFLDLHATQIQGFFDIPADNLRPDAAFVAYLQEKNLTGENTTVVAANAGGVRRAQRVASRMKAKIAILEYRTVDAQRSMNVVGTLKENVVMIDDMIDTGSRLILGAAHLKSVGAKKVFACAAHPVLSGSIDKLQESEVDEFAVTDSIPVPPEKRFPKLKVLSVAQELAEAIRRLHVEDSMSEMFY